MAKKGPKIAPASSNGGILGSGVFGMFGTTIRCDATDNSYYCNFMKFFNVFMVFLFFVFILYLIKVTFFKKGFSFSSSSSR
jgi:hypothetical protein